MLKNYLKIALRKLWKEKTYSAINIFGLAVGMTCCVLILVFAMRLAKTKKFMPAGLMIILSGATLGLLHAKF